MPFYLFIYIFILPSGPEALQRGVALKKKTHRRNAQQQNCNRTMAV